MITECLDPDGTTNPKALTAAAKQLDEYQGDLQADQLAPRSIALRIKGIKALYATNGLTLQLPYPLSNKAANHDRSPKPEELEALVNAADLRGKVIISTLALGGFRVGTLAKLRYYHIAEDLERNVIPLHVHVENSNTKGQYADYDTFLGRRAREKPFFFLSA